ncbi:MAG: class B sortase [Roseburia sp.]
MAKKKATATDWVFRIIFVIALIVFIVAAGMLIHYFVLYHRGSSEYKGLQQYVSADQSEDTETGDETLTIDFDALQALNPDCIGWIYFENLDISYPIMQGEDNEYYLEHTFEGQQVTAASIFMDYQNAADFSDENTFIYGHNMKDKTMFGKLNGYSEEDFYLENPCFYIYTPDYIYRYDIFSCYLGAVAQEEIFSLSFGSQEEYQAYLDLIQRKAAYDTGVEVTTEDRIVTLMTCNMAGHDYRFFVHGVLAEATAVSE